MKCGPGFFTEQAVQKRQCQQDILEEVRTTCCDYVGRTSQAASTSFPALHCAGRVHMVQLQAGGHFFPVSITVLDNDSMEFLFG